ncbi:MAG: TIGR00730 family Rossman fold protein [Thermoanaerobaculia bacterium]
MEGHLRSLIQSGPAPNSPPEEPAARENLEKTLASPNYVLAEDDLDYLARPEQRGVRLQLELNKTESAMHEAGIRSTIVVFGGARIVERSIAEARVAAAEKAVSDSPQDPIAQQALEMARRLLQKSHYYDEARSFGRIVSSTCQKNGFCDFVVMTGGGPGVMEAANRGAFDIDAKSVGLNIQLPHEQAPNAYITPELCFQFHYFGIRKMHFLIRAKALVAFPGGFGTLDELFETLTLIQTGKMDRVPIVLVGRAFWERLIDWQFLVDEGTIALQDLQLFEFAETGAEAWQKIVDYYSRSDTPNPEGPKLK